ncbi:MAG TPA: dihydrolipoamide acetyltransferase family protein, partial [Candidatus Bathyarchaeia archaeon]|nr:dihydrolipoamide acetyltransferase family protein [Candidatus Bathyarchaeia archaeon]
KQDVHITYLPFVIKAVVAALKEYPYLNSSLNDETEEIIVKKYYNIGVAVDTEDGLIVPVIKAADQKSIVQLAKEIQVLAEKTRSREVDLADLKGGTFTITNVGFIGGLYATPIINYPESAILALGRIYEKPVAHDEEIKIRRIMPLSLSFDHRVIDGAMAARFVNTVIKYVGDPSLLLLEKE